MLFFLCLALTAAGGIFDSHSSNEDEVCKAATKAGGNEFYEVKDYVESRGTNRPLVEQAGGSIARVRNSLAKGCSAPKGTNQSANTAINKLLFKRLMVNEWLSANVRKYVIMCSAVN